MKSSLTLILFLFSVLMNSCSGKDNSREAELVRQIDSLRCYIQNARVQVDTTNVNTLRVRPIDVSDVEIASLKRQGLNDPLKDLARSLEAHPELLPQDQRCEAGGKFFFWPTRTFWLPEDYVFASYEDGMCGGHIMLRFTVKDSTITWRRVALYPE